jgi:hypothetical protein
LWPLGRLAAAGPLDPSEFVLDLQLLALEGRDHEVIMADMSQFILDLPIELPVPSLKGGHMAFSRHHNSFQRFRAIPIVTNNSPLVDAEPGNNMLLVEKLVQILARSVNLF